MSKNSADDKSSLLAMVLEADAGRAKTAEQQEAIETASRRLEAQNPTASPSEHLELMAGLWKLLYTTTGLEKHTTLHRLSFGQFPQLEVNVTGVYQKLTIEDASYTNLIEFTAAPSLAGVLSICAQFEVLTPVRLQINFKQALVSPNNPEINLTAWREALGINDSQTINLSVDLNYQGWIDTTYLDDDLRLARGNMGNLYILELEHK